MSDSFAAGLVGITLDGRYRLDALLGEGGMGAVFRATHLAMERKVAVKLLKPHLTTDQTSLQRFAREARSTLKVESPHAVKVLDFGVTHLRDYYMVLEYLDGRTVQRELDVDGPFAPSRVVHIARHALHALGAAHSIGLVHRDIKPDNLLLMRVGDDPDFTKVLDFGVAKLMEGVTPSSEQSMLSLTAHGTVFGTPEFMSPEQACGQSLDGRSDLYSLAATMFAMLTGCALFEGRAPIEWLMHHARTPPPHLAMVSADLAAYPELDELLQQCLAKQRELRPQDAAEMSQMLAAIEPTLARKPGAAPPSPSKRVSVFSKSSYTQTLPPEARQEMAATIAPPPTSGANTAALLRAAQPRSRGIYILLLALVVAAFVATAIVLAVRKASSHGGSDGVADAAAPRPDAAIAQGFLDAPTVVPVVVDAPPVDAGAIDARIRTPIPAADARVATDTKFDALLRDAEAARGKSPIERLSAAQLAYEANPRNVRAAYLFGDAMISTGSVDRGCALLRQLTRYAPAVERVKTVCTAP